jgi:phosphopantothenoylcysteine decarboxylase/phosphopantothenate--cysteine ligase
LELEHTVDILQSLRDVAGPIKVGFAAETNDLIAYAADKVNRKHLDLIVANDAVASIGQPDIELTLLDADGQYTTLPRQNKAVAAAQVLEYLLGRWPERLATTTQSNNHRVSTLSAID